MNHQTLPYAQIAPNAYNPNVMPDRVYRAELESIARFGFIDPITVREIEGENGVMIIDGEHRWRAFGELRENWKAGDCGEYHPSLETLFEKNELPVVNLGALSDADAKKLTIILNETRGRANTVDLAALLAEIGETTGGAELAIGLPYSDEELAELLRLAEFDWESVKATSESAGESGEASGETEAMQSFTATMPQSSHAVYVDAIERVRARLQADGLELPGDGPLLHGQVVELLAAEFLAGP